MADSLFDPSRIYNALKEAGALPTWVQRKPFDEDVSASFRPQTNTLTVEKDSKSDGLAHELTHAAQFNLLQTTAYKLAHKKGKLTEKEKQFLDSMQKLMGVNDKFGVSFHQRQVPQSVGKNLDKSIEALYGERKDKFDYYRTQPIELQAWGVGGMTDKGQPSKLLDQGYKPHLNPSYASEFDILLTMYEQLPKESKDVYTKPKQKDPDIQKWDTVVDMNEDPFKPTIK